MCYAIPAKVLSMQDEHAKVDYGGVIKEINISLIGNISVGDFVLIHAGFAIERLDTQSAEESLKIIEEYFKHGN